MTSFTTILQGHNSLQERKTTSLEKLEIIQGRFSGDPLLIGRDDICIFSAGSLGRLDSGTKSDLDIFVTADGGEESKIGRLEEIELFSSILRINRELEFPELSNDGEYLKVFDIHESKSQIGSPADDNENWFTVRMLLLLESRHLINPTAYTRHTKEILSVYFRDAEDHKPFKPLFLLNDILRFWRTLCLNYEQARHTPSRAWKKKNFNLRFSEC
ncbi:MAG: hypothetical protein WC091_13840 [Sulfuricellaceae bacterium]